MANDRRDCVWLECTSCGQRNYRAERLMKTSTPQGKSGPPANMVNQRLEMNKYCRWERKHTLHRETRKK